MKSYDWTFILVLLMHADCIMVVLIASQVGILALFAVLWPVSIILLMTIEGMDRIDAYIERSMALKEMRK